MKKVLLCTPMEGVQSGISRWAHNIIDYYKENGCADVQIDVCPMDRNVYFGEGNTSLRRYLIGLKDYLAIFRKYKQDLSENKYDVVHIATSASISVIKDYVFIRWAKRKGVKVVIHFHFGRIPLLSMKKNWEWKMIRQNLGFVDKAVVIDNDSFRSLLDQGFENVVFVPNPVGSFVLNANRDTPICREDKKVIFVGHVIETKGVFELVKACSSINGVKLELVGNVDDKTKVDLENCICGMDNSWLRIVGPVGYDEVLKRMMSCALFVLPSYSEGFPNVILESMACGCTIISTPVGAIPEMLDIDGENPCGELVPVKDVAKLREKIEQLLQDKARSIMLGDNARDRVSREYSVYSVFDKLVSVWTNL